MKRLQVRDGYFRDSDGKPIYLLGANFWPKHTGPWMYRDSWDPQAVAGDLAEIAALGANVIRTFCFLPDFLPAPDVVSEPALGRFDKMVELAAKAGLWSIPTFLVGHMSGENWEPEWSRGKNWYTDPVLLDASELLIGTMAAHFAHDARIAAWLLTNEWPLFAGASTSKHALEWARRLIAVVRAADPTGNVSIGDGAWDVIGGQSTGLVASALRGDVDFFGPHFYPKETDALRQSAFAGFAMRMLQPLGSPILLEEFGCSSDQADDELAAGYYRTTLWSAFGAGNCGTLVWNSHDFTTTDRAPYVHHPYELHFGLIRVDGTHKPQAAEFSRFGAYAAGNDPDAWEPLPTTIAIGRTSYYANEFPFDWGWSKPELRDLFLQAYSVAVQAGINVAFVDLATLRFGQISVLIVPCMQQVTTEDAAALERFARDGGSVYLSYGGEPWFPNLGKLVGARLLIRYGLVEEPGSEFVHFHRGFADIKKDSELQFPIRGDARRAAPIRCTPTEAEAVASDRGGNAVLLERALGSGRVIFATHPLEYYLLHGVNANAESDLWKIYRAIASVGKTRPRLRAADPDVQVFTWRSRQDPKRQRLLLINHGWKEKRTEILGITEGARDLESGERIAPSGLVLPVKGVRLVEFIAAG